jgi:predicted nucleic-acid-binding protein
MIALDTNILARYLLNDDPVQAKAAASLLSKREKYTAPVTVMLELVWVLQVNDCAREEIVRGLSVLLGLPNFKPKEFNSLTRALNWYSQGMDFADALHLALSSKDAGFCTFDKTLMKRASAIAGGTSVSMP